MTFRLAYVLMLCAAGGVRAQALHDDSARVLFEANLRALAKSGVPFELRRPLANAIPPRVQITHFVWNPPVATLTVAAQGFDDVSAFLLRLRELVSSPWGLARVVERRGDSRARVLLMNGEVLEFDSVEVELVDGGEVLEFSRDQTHFVFSGLELTSTSVGPPATFELMMSLP